jgi:ubiquinone/menaquinone biosynthesis C-methylase UbiE
MYERYAAVYDGSGQVRYALLAAPYIHELLQSHPLSGRRAIDIACGTGTLALLLAGTGWEMLGVDAAPAMLAEAEAKASDAELEGRVAFLQADMRRLAEVVPPGTFDLATCLYDSLNYMQEEADLGACFASAAHVLRPGGLYIGDMNTRHFLEHEWGFCDVREQSGYVQVEQSWFDPISETTTLHLTGFIGDDERGYERFDEQHRERAYADATVERLLAAAGLRVEGRYDSFTHEPPGPRTQRIFWVARKLESSDEDDART